MSQTPKKAKSDKGAKVGRYQQKRKLGIVPLHFSEPCRRFCSAAKEGSGPALDAARKDHDRYLDRLFGSMPMPEEQREAA